MDKGRRFDFARLWQEYGLRLMRYGGVTIVSTVIGLSTLAFGLYVLNWSGLASNFLSVLMATPPAYYLNRQWVWGQQAGDHSVSGEIGPFWIMTLLGWIVSSIVVYTVETMSDIRILAIAGQIASFAALWLVKFAFLEKYLWKDKDRVRERV